MSRKRTRCGWNGAWLGSLLLLGGALVAAEEVRLKSGEVYRGTVDRDGTTVQVFDADGLKRVVVRDTKVAEVGTDTTPPGERFKIAQPMTVHGGEMPPFALKVQAGPWKALGRRQFSYLGKPSGKTVTMQQAITELTPRAARFRGIDGFWTGVVGLDQVPRPVVVEMLNHVEQGNENERLRVGRFLIQAEWYPEAKSELDRLASDFPHLKDTVATVRMMVLGLEAREAWRELELRRTAGQPRGVLQRLQRFPVDGASEEVLAAVRDLLRAAEQQANADRALGEALRTTADGLGEEGRRAIEPRLLEMLTALEQAPDAVRARFDPFRKAAPTLDPARRLALATSGWLLGPEEARDDPAAIEVLWQARDLTRQYLRTTASTPQADRAALLQQLEMLQIPAEGGDSQPLDLALLTNLVRQMAPPLADLQAVPAGGTRLMRVYDDPNPEQPSEYALFLPPEYHPLRTYPAIVSLHGDDTPTEAIAWLEAEATRRGYVVIAPEYNLRGASRDYRFSPAEHAAVELALRDALRRFAIDPDRVFLVGQHFGANMALDFGLSHPDLFAGVASVSGLPAKYVWSTRSNAALVPLYLVEGSLVPAVTEVIFDQLVKPLITRNHDIIYTEYFRRGLEPLPEEAPSLFAWMASRKRDPAPREFSALAGRDCDVRFHGLVIRGFANRRALPPEAVDPDGKNLKPASVEYRANSLLNKLVVKTGGVTALDVWVSPAVLDFSKRLEVQVNGKTVYRGEPKRTELGPFLDDLRFRGDRKQVYWLRVPFGSGQRGGS